MNGVLQTLVRVTRRWTGDGPSESDARPERQQRETNAAASERGDEHPVAATTRSEAFARLFDRDQVSPVDVLVTTGLQPADFLVALVRHEDGQMWQGEIRDVTGWSSSTVSRRLCLLESQERIQRLQLGRRKLVSLPERAPETRVAAGESHRGKSRPQRGTGAT